MKQFSKNIIIVDSEVIRNLIKFSRLQWQTDSFPTFYALRRHETLFYRWIVFCLGFTSEGKLYAEELKTTNNNICIIQWHVQYKPCTEIRYYIRNHQAESVANINVLILFNRKLFNFSWTFLSYKLLDDRNLV